MSISEECKIFMDLVFERNAENKAKKDAWEKGPHDPSKNSVEDVRDSFQKLTNAKFARDMGKQQAFAKGRSGQGHFKDGNFETGQTYKIKSRDSLDRPQYNNTDKDHPEYIGGQKDVKARLLAKKHAKEISEEIIAELKDETEKRALGARDARLYDKWDHNEDDSKDLNKAIKHGQHYIDTKGGFNCQTDKDYQKGLKDEQAKLAKKRVSEDYKALVHAVVEGVIKDRNKAKKNTYEIKQAEANRPKEEREGYLKTAEGQKYINQKTCKDLENAKTGDAKGDKAIDTAKSIIADATRKVLGRKDPENPHQVGSSPIYKELRSNLDQKAEAIKSHGPGYDANKETIKKNIERERGIKPSLPECVECFMNN